MDACLTHAEPATAPTPREAAARFDAARWIRIAAIATIVVGLGWRIVRYLGHFPIWGDEAMLLLNILQRDYAGLTEHLRFAQVAPLFFLWLEKTAIHVFGTSEWSVHLFPMLMGLVAFGVFWWTCRSAFTPAVAGLAVGVLAVSYYPVRHACEVKPYVFDLGFAVLYLWLTLAYLRDLPSPSGRGVGGEGGSANDRDTTALTPNPSPRGRGEPTRWLILLVLVTPLAVFASYPSVFVAGSVSLVLLPTMRSATWTQRSLYVLFNLVMVASFIVHFGFVGHHQIDAAEAQRTRDFLRAYWKDAFPPADVVEWPVWLLKVFTGNTLAYPIGAKNGGSAITFLLVLVGSVTLWRSGQRALLALCWLPFTLNLVAAILGKYPFGDSARITLHLAPFICVLTAHGIVQAISWIRSAAWQTRVHFALYALLLGCGIVGIARDLVHPYKTEHDREVRQLTRDIAAQLAPGEPVLLGHQRDEELLPELLWNLRARALPMRWQSAGVDADTRSYWLVQCSHVDPGVMPTISGWRVTASELRMVPPENDKLHPVYCRWVRLVRE
jgi:Dolichyl-phosphate-mannose-protein mannosyltransferase